MHQKHKSLVFLPFTCTTTFNLSHSFKQCTSPTCAQPPTVSEKAEHLHNRISAGTPFSLTESNRPFGRSGANWAEKRNPHVEGFSGCSCLCGRFSKAERAFRLTLTWVDNRPEKTPLAKERKCSHINTQKKAEGEIKNQR